MAKIDVAKTWSLNYRLLLSVITSVTPALAKLGVDSKELFVLNALDEHPYPAELATQLCMPRPTVTTNVKRLEAAGLLRREIDRDDLRRHRLLLTPAGRKVATAGLALLTEAFGARLSRLTGAQQAELHALLEKLG
jgi:DNA-binding MarR family transcriptional regulator